MHLSRRSNIGQSRARKNPDTCYHPGSFFRCWKRNQICKKFKMCQKKEGQVVAVAEKEEGELRPCAGCGKVLPIAVWWLLQGSISKGQRWSVWLLAGSLGTWWSAECAVSPCQQQSPRESSWSTCQLLQRLEPRDCVWWGVQRGCCPAKCEHQCPLGVSSKAFRNFRREETHPYPLGCKAFLVSHARRADCNCGIFFIDDLGASVQRLKRPLWMELAQYTSACGACRQAPLRKNSRDSDLQTAHSLLSILLSAVW